MHDSSSSAAGADEFPVSSAQTADTGHSQCLLAGIVDEALETVDGTDFASLAVITQPGRIESLAPSAALPLLLDWAQIHFGQGPSLDAIEEHRIVRVPDLSTEDRWPDFAGQARTAGIGSMLTIPLFVDDDTPAALNLYSTAANAFTAHSERLGLDLGAQAETSFAEGRTLDQLRQALLSRDTIGQAKGVLIERFKITDEEAFWLLTRASSLPNRRLRDIAAELARTGALPGMRNTGLDQS